MQQHGGNKKGDRAQMVYSSVTFAKILRSDNGVPHPCRTF